MNPLKEIFESGQTILRIETQNEVALLRPVPDILVWTPCPTSCLAQCLCFRQIGFVLPQRVFRPLALGYINHSTGVLNEIATRAENRMTNAVNVPDGSTRMHN